MRKVSSLDGTTIAYDRSGSGPAVILVGGAFQVRTNPGLTGLAALLSDRFTVLCHDRRGRGDSGDTAPYAVDREIEDLAALIEAAGGPAALVGMSSGAALALRAARVLPVTRLALYEPPFVVDASRPPLPADYLPTLDALIAAGRPDEAVDYFMASAIGLPPEAIAPMRESPFRAQMTAVAHTLAYDGAVMADTMSGRPLAAEWAGAAVPTLVLTGSDTFDWIRASTLALAALLPDGRHAVLPGQTHAVDPAVLAPVLAEFLTG